MADISSALQRMRFAVSLLFLLAFAATLQAQTRSATAGAAEPAVVWRPFFLASGERFAARKTFDAVLGAQALRPFWGGGVQIGLRRGLFVEIAVSRFSATGQRAFAANGQAFPLGIPLTATITPIEVMGGYRYRLSKTIVPYAAVGVGRYAYSETSTGNDPGEDVAESRAGLVVLGGAEFRVHRWVGVGVEVQYTRVTGVLGKAGISQTFGEDDLGGTAARVKILVGR
ncbi:MAG: outer membrane beta-barrel protein [Acidobacteriota bacterium]